MEPLHDICHRFYTMLTIPLALVGPDGTYVQGWPEGFFGIVRPEFTAMLLEDFRAENRDPLHPLILFVNSGFFVGVIQLAADDFLIVGPVCPFRYSQKELLESGSPVILSDHLQTFAEILVNTPVMRLPQLQSCMCLMVRMISQAEVAEDDILFSGGANHLPYSADRFGGARFQQRETSEGHTRLTFEDGFCQAVMLGRSDLLLQALSNSPGGSVGMMSPDTMRQRRYSFVIFAALITRAAIRGGLAEETAFLLSDIYCQRMDTLKSSGAIDQLTVGMAVDFCDKVAKNRLPQQVSPVVQKALSYITVHLHEPFGMEELAQYCHLCRRSLTIHFRKEVGMTVGEYVQQEKVEEAKFLLRHTGISLPEIAAYLNYSSQSYFTQVFRKYVGETPQVYRDSRSEQDDSAPAGSRPQPSVG